MIKVLLSILLLLFGMAQALPCSTGVARDSDRDCLQFPCSSHGVNFAVDTIGNKQPSPEPFCSHNFCSILCQHAVSFNVTVWFFKISSYPLTNSLPLKISLPDAHLDSLTRPPRIA